MSPEREPQVHAGLPDLSALDRQNDLTTMSAAREEDGYAHSNLKK